MITTVKTIQEIHRQPDTWKECLSLLRKLDLETLVGTRQPADFPWVFVGCGTSYYLAQAAAASFTLLTGTRSRALPASEILLYPELSFPSPKSMFPVLISRSGHTSEILAVAEILKERGIELLGLVDIVLPNEAEACRMTQTNDVEAAAEGLARQVPIVAIKCGSRGALLRFERKRWLVPAERVIPLDTIGAGESFNAGFLQACLRGCSPVECAVQGNRVAALSTQRAGGIAAFQDASLRSLLTT